MLHNGIRRHRRTESPDNNTDQARFECWSLHQAIYLIRHHRDALSSGCRAAMTGAPCPGPSYHDAYRLGWEIGAVYAKRNATPRWMATLEAEAADYHERRKAAAAASVTIH